jgi:hypothetical protein
MAGEGERSKLMAADGERSEVMAAEISQIWGRLMVRIAWGRGYCSSKFSSFCSCFDSIQRPLHPTYF